MMGSQRVFPFCNADIRMGFYTGMMRHFLPCLIHMYGDSAIYVWGDVSRGSTGVHELGFNPIKRCPLRRGIIPTITITDGTLENAPEAAAEIFEDANRYARMYLEQN